MGVRYSASCFINSLFLQAEECTAWGCPFLLSPLGTGRLGADRTSLDTGEGLHRQHREPDMDF